MSAALVRRPTIGLFDSGVGGLSVFRALRTRLPHADYLYVADSGHCPYGPRSDTEIRDFSQAITDFLIARDVEMIIVACNTASAAALAFLRRCYPDVPFVGMVPAVKPAAAATHSGVVGVLATPTTYGGTLYHKVVDDYGRDIEIISAVCPGLVEQIERGDLDGPETVSLLESCLEPLVQAGVDTLVLGCTHYPFVTEVIERLLGSKMRIMEPSEAIARQAVRVLGARALSDADDGSGQLTLYTTGDSGSFGQVAAKLLRYAAPVEELVWRRGRLVSCLQGEASPGVVA